MRRLLQDRPYATDYGSYKTSFLARHWRRVLFGVEKEAGDRFPGFVGTDENNFIAAIQLCIRAGRYDAGGTAPDSYDCRTCRLPEMQLAEIPSVAIPSLWNAENIVWQGIVRLNRKHGIVKNTAAQIGKLV